MGDDSNFPGYDGLDRATLRRYVAGRSDAAERRRVEAWAAEAVHRRRYLAAMLELFQRDPAGQTQETAAAWERIAARMEPPPHTSGDTAAYVAPWERPPVHVTVRRPQPPRVLSGAFMEQRRRRWPVLATAAALFLVLLGGTLFLNTSRHTPPPAPHPTMRQVATAKGQRAEIQLSDGSRVMLGVESRLRFSPTWGGAGRAREVHLEGTAYFDVVHDSTRPFLVHTANAVTADIGTEFVVIAYPETHSTQVVVAEGAVALRGAQVTPASPVVLTPGRLGRLAAGDPVATVRTVDPALYSGWRDGKLVFHDTPLAEVVAELRRWYDVDVQLGDSSLGDAPLTASFVAESFEDAIGVVTTVLPLRAARRGKAVTLYGR